MKLSFSTKGWHNRQFEEFCEAANYIGFKGIELHNINNRLFTEKDGAFHDYAAAATLRRLFEKKLEIPCIDVVSDIANSATQNGTVDEIKRCLLKPVVCLLILKLCVRCSTALPVIMLQHCGIYLTLTLPVAKLLSRLSKT